MKAILHGVWLFRDRPIFDDRRVWLEQSNGAWAQTPFNRAVGLKQDEFGCLIYRGMLAELKGPAQSISQVMARFYGHQLMSVRSVSAVPLDRAKGVAVLSAPRLRLRSVPGIAKLVAIVGIRADDEP
ncbi:hypothetical protein [Stenotrophomonas humi]